jgi:serine/threonine protein kinase
MSGHVMGGRYRLEQELGRGGMATVWRAQDTRLERTAAVKVLDPVWRADPVALERLRREAHSVARLAHQNIVGMYDFDVADDAAYLVMELVEGRRVTELLAARGRLPIAQVVSIAAQVCDALGAAHAAGVVHRDIKPSNILVGPTGAVKVCDFGVALLQQGAGHAALTSPGNVVGTCHYMAPEQAMGDPVDGRSDLYAVGCVLYMMLVGVPPFNATNPIDVLDMHLNEPPVPLRAHRNGVPPALHQLVGELLAKDPADRPASAWSVRDRLTAITDGSAPTTELPDHRSTAPTMVHPVVARAPVTATSGDRGTDGRHRATLAAVPVISWLRQWVSGWVLVLVAGALVTVVAAAIALAAGGQPDTAVGEPPSSLTASQDAAAPSAEPTPSTDPSQPTATPSPTTAATSPPARATPIDQIGGLAAVVQQQADAGQLQSKAARTLLRDLNEVARRLSVGKTAAAAEMFTEFRDRVTEFRRDGKLTAAGSDALPDLDRIAESLDAG